tara:strand:- start:116 stop:448 length:333 start_codon:yes stop_codon:yes gene_type:complete
MTIEIAINWILFLALFPLAYFWLKKAWKIYVKKDFSEIALKFGSSPSDPSKYALISFIVNVFAGIFAVIIIILIPSIPLEAKIWTEFAGILIWLKIFIDFIISRHAHFKK